MAELTTTIPTNRSRRICVTSTAYGRKAKQSRFWNARTRNRWSTRICPSLRCIAITCRSSASLGNHQIRTRRLRRRKVTRKPTIARLLQRRHPEWNGDWVGAILILMYWAWAIDSRFIVYYNSVLWKHVSPDCGHKLDVFSKNKEIKNGKWKKI